VEWLVYDFFETDLEGLEYALRLCVVALISIGAVSVAVLFLQLL
jgi:hypothetical protein